MDPTFFLLIIGLLGVGFLYLIARLWLAEHDARILRERYVVPAPQSSGGGCLVLLLLALAVGLAFWIFLHGGS